MKQKMTVQSKSAVPFLYMRDKIGSVVFHCLKCYNRKNYPKIKAIKERRRQI